MADKPAVISESRTAAEAPRVTNHGTEEISLKVESMQHMGSMLEIDPESLNPAYIYRWVHKSPLKVARAKAKGYRVVQPSEDEIKNVVGDSPEAEDGTYTVGDLVLMRTQRATFRGRRKLIKKRADARLKGPERKFRQKAEQVSVNFSAPVKVITDEE